MKNKLDAVLNRIQLYSYLLPTVKIGNAIMDFREKYTLSGYLARQKAKRNKIDTGEEIGRGQRMLEKVSEESEGITEP